MSAPPDPARPGGPNVTFPLTLRFKLLAIGSELSATNAAGELLAVVKERKFSLRDEVRVFADREKTRQTHSIRADRVLDWNAVRLVTRADGAPLGAVRAQGARTWWAAHYDILGPDGTALLSLREDRPLLKLIDGLLDLVPIVGDVLGLVVGYFVNPTYTASGAGGPVLRIVKRRGFFERTFTVEELSPLPEEERELALLALVQIVLRERERG